MSACPAQCVWFMSCCVSGAIIFDGFSVKIPEKPLEDFRAFFGEANALQAQSSLQNGGDKGPARHKISVHPASFASVLETGDWTCPDERRLRESFWLGTEWAIQQEDFMKSLPQELASFDSKKFFCERYSAVKPLFQCVGDLLPLNPLKSFFPGFLIFQVFEKIMGRVSWLSSLKARPADLPRSVSTDDVTVHDKLRGCPLCFWRRSL